jgi:HEAT repeat protein
MVATVRASESVGGRRFLHDALGGMPEAFPVVAPLLNSLESHEVRHAAGILGRMGCPEAVGPLKERLAHPDANVRATVLLALAEFPVRDTADALRAALAHPSPATRAAAADAIGRTRAPGLVMPIVAALETESDGAAWSAMVSALAGLASPEACAALTALALARRRLVGGGHATPRRIEAVRALATVAAPCRTPALERLAREGDEAVRDAAAAALAAREGRTA